MKKEIESIAQLIASNKQPVIIEVRPNVTRVIAEIFEQPDGIAFADIGYCDPLRSSHAYHFVDGEITGDDPWKIGESVIRTAMPEESYYAEWEAWLLAKKEHGCTREIARADIEDEFDVKVV